MSSSIYHEYKQFRQVDVVFKVYLVHVGTRFSTLTVYFFLGATGRPTCKCLRWYGTHVEGFLSVFKKVRVIFICYMTGENPVS